MMPSNNLKSFQIQSAIWSPPPLPPTPHLICEKFLITKQSSFYICACRSIQFVVKNVEQTNMLSPLHNNFINRLFNRNQIPDRSSKNEELLTADIIFIKPCLNNKVDVSERNNTWAFDEV